MFEHNSRYYRLETATLSAPDGRVIAYKRRRFLPRSESMPLLVEVAVTQGDRLDLITARALVDPEQFWRVCDANEAMRPSELTDKAGRLVEISMPSP
jgi:hypothetical protein